MFELENGDAFKLESHPSIDSAKLDGSYIGFRDGARRTN